MTLALVLTAFGPGLRHGIDRDHVAAIADLSGSTSKRGRGFILALLYAVGHSTLVFVLGALRLLTAIRIPASLDHWMGRVVGLTLVFLGCWLFVDLLRSGADARLRNRWMLIVSGTWIRAGGADDVRPRR